MAHIKWQSASKPKGKEEKKRQISQSAEEPETTPALAVDVPSFHIHRQKVYVAQFLRTSTCSLNEKSSSSPRDRAVSPDS